MMGRLDNDIDFSYVDSVSMSPNTYPTTYFSYTHYDNNTTDVVHSVFPCYELYFNTLHKVVDTFYVGFSVDNHSILEPSAFAFQSHFYEMINFAAFIINEEPQITVFKEFYYGVGDTVIGIANGHWGGIFPILQPDRPYCNPVGGLRVVERGQDYATLCWDNAGDSVYYQLVFGDDAANPIFTYDTCYTRTGLDTNTLYNAHLRRVCHHDCPYHPDSTLNLSQPHRRPVLADPARRNGSPCFHWRCRRALGLRPKGHGQRDALRPLGRACRQLHRDRRHPARPLHETALYCQINRPSRRFCCLK